MQSSKKLRKRLDALLSASKQAKKEVDREKKKHSQVVCLESDSKQAQQFLQNVAKAVQEVAHDRISSVVSKCLALVFDEPYEMRIHFERKRGKTEARLYFVREGIEVDPLSATGGGVVDVAAFALRLACLALAKPKLRRILVLDEPFRFVSAEYRDRIRDMVTALAKEMDVQFILVTHIDELKTGKIVEL